MAAVDISTTSPLSIALSLSAIVAVMCGRMIVFLRALQYDDRKVH